MTTSTGSRSVRSQLTLVSVEQVTARDRHTPNNPTVGIESSFDSLPSTTHGGESGAATFPAIPSAPDKMNKIQFGCCSVFGSLPTKWRSPASGSRHE